MAQVLANLLNNAAKYTDEGGRIDLELVLSGNEAVFRVCDNGIGIDQEKLPTVFDLFTQVDNSLDRTQGGLGIGLTLVRFLVEMHSGTVQATSDGAGLGSQFSIRLPALDETVPVATTARTPLPHIESSLARRILIVDDYPLVAESLMRVLALAGHQVRTAHDAPAALEVISAFDPEIIVLDIGLPGMNGYDLAKHIRVEKASNHVTLIAATGYGQNEDRHKALEAGFDHHLTKPVDCGALSKLIESTQRKPRGRGSTSPFLSPA
jgi:CheY-like chemotaxis protein